MGESLPLPQRELAQAFVEHQLQAGRGSHRDRGDAGAGEVGGPEQGGAELRHGDGRGLGLGAAHLVELDVELALDAPGVVPGGAAVAEQDQAATGHRSWETTSAGSGIAGQSRQSRSRA